MSRRLLIASGTWKYPGIAGIDRPTLEATVQSVVDLFTRLGYRRELETLGGNPVSGEFVSTLDDWFRAPERDPDDWVVFYYTGHGVLQASEFFLLTSDSKTGALSSKAFDVRQLARFLLDTDAEGARRRVKKILFIIDACNSGMGAATITTSLFASFLSDRDDLLISVIAAAFPNQEAFAGRLAAALIAAIDDEATGGAQQEFLHLDYDLMPKIRATLKGQKALYTTIQTAYAPLFIPNPRFNGKLPPAVEVSALRRAASAADLATHWGPRARGVDFDSDLGSFFTGRTAALTEISGWLRTSKDARTVVVTGSPGAGKSAVLSKIVTLSDPEYRTPQRKDPWKKAIGKSVVDVAIHARGKTGQDVLDRMSDALNVPAGNLTATLAARRKPLRVVVDALDEAAEPQAIADLLRPLHALRGVKLLVGTRPEFAAKLGDTAHAINLDRAEYSSQDDLVRYMETRLVASQKPEYSDHRFVASVAAAAAVKAENNFLVARLLAEDLIQHPPRDAAELATRRMAANADVAFADYLRRYGNDELRVRDILRPLAWSFGAGLPWSNLWAPLAGALSPEAKVYDDDDVRWVLDQAGAFVLEAREDGKSAYRLFHQAIADYLRRPDQHREERIHSSFVDVMRDSVVLLEESEQRDWRAAHPYIRKHFPEHCARAGRLESFLRDPLFLLCMVPTRLERVLPAFENEQDRAIAGSFRDSAYQIQTEPYATAAAYLECSARKLGAERFADRVAALPGVRPWNTRWLEWDQSQATRVLVRPPEPATAVALSEVDGQILVAWGHNDGTVSVVDCLENTAVGQVQLLESRVAHVGLCGWKGRIVIAAASEEGKIVLQALDGKSIETHAPARHVDELSVFTLGNVHGGLMLACVGTGGLRILNIAGARSRQHSLGVHVPPITCLQFQQINGAPYLVGADMFGTCLVVDPVTGTLQSYRGAKKWVTRALYLLEGTNNPMVVCVPGQIAIPDLAGGHNLAELRGTAEDVAGILEQSSSGERGLVFVYKSGEVRRWALPALAPVTSNRRIQAKGLAAGTLDGAPVVVTVKSDRKIHFIHPETGAEVLPACDAGSHPQRIRGILTADNEIYCLVSQVSFEASIISARTGQIVATYRAFRQMAICERGGRPVVIVEIRGSGPQPTETGQQTYALEYRDVLTGVVEQQIGGENGGHYLLCAALLSGRWLMAYANKGFVTIRELETSGVVQSLKVPDKVGALLLIRLADSDAIVIAQKDRVVAYAIHDGRELASFPVGRLPAVVLASAVVNGQTCILAGSSDGTVISYALGSKTTVKIDAGAAITGAVLTDEGVVVLATDAGLIAFDISASLRKRA